MKITVLIDNIPSPGLAGEWGLSFLIEYNDHKILLDTGSSDQFLDNAKKLNIDLAGTDLAVLSHAHYDHANGFPAFFRINHKAKCYVQRECLANCHSQHGWVKAYIGIPRKMLTTFSDRILIASDFAQIGEDIYLIGHQGADLSFIGQKNKLYTRKGLRFLPDRFAHEQSLVFTTPKGLVIFNSCSHGGVSRIIADARERFPDQPVYAYLGGMHLSKLPEEDVLALSEELKPLQIEKIYTGHCTGDKAFQLLRGQLGERIRQFYSGMVIEW